MGAMNDTLPLQRNKDAALGKPVRCVTWARLVANVALAVALISCIGLLLYEDTSVAMIVQFSSGHMDGTVTRTPIQTSRRCNRVDVPLRFANSTQGPYNPAAVQSPQTGEWLLFLTLDEVRPTSAVWGTSAVSMSSCTTRPSLVMTAALPKFLKTAA